MSQENTIPYASGSVRPSWINRRAHGAGLRLVAIALLAAAAIYAESNNPGDLFIFNFAKTTFLVSVLAFAAEFVLSFFQ